MTWVKRALAPIGVLIFLTGCSGGEPAPVVTETVTATATATVTATPSPEAAESSEPEPIIESAEPDEAETDAFEMPAKTYPGIDEVDPYTSTFFIAMEDEGSDPVTYLGGMESSRDAFLWNMGVMLCKDLDEGQDFDEAFDYLMENSQLGDNSGVLAGAAVSFICGEHEMQARLWAERNN